MPMVIKPKNWKDFQHYKDRAPPWIKLHKSLLDNYEFHSLQLASKALAPCYWLLASEHQEGFIEVDERKLAWRFRVSEKIISETVKELISSGFFELVQDASKTLAGCQQLAMLETETETEKNNGDFEKFWKAASVQYKRAGSSIGNKQEAAREWGKLNQDADTCQDMLIAIAVQAEAKENATGFVAPFKHVCRWLKLRCWEDEAEDCIDTNESEDWKRGAL